MPFQRTLRNSVGFHGIGLHSGREVTLRLRPAPVDSGVMFMRTDLSPPVRIDAAVQNVVNTRLSTTLAAHGYAVGSVEHFLAACHAMEIDNVMAEIDGPELPILDGSSLVFARAMAAVGAVEQPAQRRFLVITRPVSVTEGRSCLAVYPASCFQVTCTITFRHPAMESQSRHHVSMQEAFLDEYAPARTFGFLSEIEHLKRNGLARGGSLANAVIIGSHGVVNREGLRFEDEPVRHKILDLAGDLRLSGHSIIGHFRAFRSGHYLNCRLVGRILGDPGCRTWIERGQEVYESAGAFRDGIRRSGTR